MTTLFFGGSFDPPHIGHLILPRDVMEHFGFKKVIYIPAYISPFKVKQGHRAPAEERLKMLELAIEGVPYYGIETFEIDRKRVSYTYLTVEYLREKYDLKRVYWLMGDDTFKGLNKWFRFEELRKLITPVVMVRTLEPKEVERLAEIFQLKEFLFFSARRLEISSTEIRNRLREGKDIRFMVPDKVYNYIRERGLYSNL